MTRRRKKRRLPSLFPFLSVLLCAMGVLIVVISAQNLIVVGGELDQVLEVGGGEYADRSPIYVECREEGIVIYPERQEIPLEAIDFSPDEVYQRIEEQGGQFVFRHPESNAWTDLVDRLATNYDSEYLVLLIRPNGIKAFDACAIWVYLLNSERQYNSSALDYGEIRMGKDALLPGGDLILTEDGKPLLPESETRP